MKLARAAATVLAMAVLVACSEDPEPNIEPSESPTSPSSPTSSATSEPPEVLGPEETVRAWVEGLNSAFADGNVSGVAELSDPSCKSCRDLFEPIADVYENGGSIETTGWTVVSSRVKSRTETSAVVTAAVRYAPGETIPKAGADSVRFEGESHLMTFDLADDSGSWRLAVVGYIS